MDKPFRGARSWLNDTVEREGVPLVDRGAKETSPRGSAEYLRDQARAHLWSEANRVALLVDWRADRINRQHGTYGAVESVSAKVSPRAYAAAFLGLSAPTTYTARDEKDLPTAETKGRNLWIHRIWI